MLKRPFIALLLLAPALAVAQDAGGYLTQAQLDGAMAALPAPSAPGSAEDQADRAATDRAFAARSEADFAQAKLEEKFGAFDFAPVIGAGFRADKFPHVAALFKEAERETKEAVDLSKNHWKRLRPCPPASDCAKNPAEAAKKSYGYPSGHSSKATVDAILLAQLFPQDADALMQHARDIGWRRVVKGVHTLQDIYAGREFGQTLATDMLASPAMQHDLAAAREELRAAGLVASASPNPPQAR
ncbi:phosphatase PAP2 family protein [Dyella solisilvae]|uniref:Acid phosphatase n=1 Tax=Dyella solisilvae TaxID=1920168 RepID=A0A370K3G0_9GAMM|nr:phosphatase PAP2 family protein [Dyella solisilvae]RDI97181.1 phosphatase PAP2 family protein [Dyella solisilvae]